MSRRCVSHNASSKGSSKILQQHANETAVAFASDATSSCARSLKISSTLRQGCILDPKDALSKFVGSRRDAESSKEAPAADRPLCAAIARRRHKARFLVVVQSHGLYTIH